ncbi:MAG: DNA primase [Candidatus Carbobacillus altaicus]|uniref:DNA primase n=1 Tax=Candidatus Carbonibacillus altaicus TaxID=2163959 RepID=A0A2R6Y2Z1_9BACL|nr:DNA primase [Candidatus Carbobacillus altaicus]PTQ57044.1 MAG: DNA primase [Candidatus Carbobacillus altaicus]
MRIPETVIESVRQASDIVDVIGSYVQLKKQGKNYMGLCPFHADRTPSFSVVPDKQFFHCFGCHIGGDVFRFIMEIEGLSYPEAIQFLAEKAGVPLPDVELKQEDERAFLRRRLKEAHALAAQYYHYVLNQTKYGETAKEYLWQRGLLDATIEAYHLGYAPGRPVDHLTRFLLKRGFTEEELTSAGLSMKEDGNKKLRDRFLDRVMIPLEDVGGAIVAFTGRRLDDGKPKYLNSPETPIFSKSKMLFNLSRAKRTLRRSGTAILLEGHLDVLTLVQSGLTDVVASGGTSFTEEMALLLRRYVERAIILFDSDEAGLTSAERTAEILLDQGMEVRIGRLPDGQDPDAYVRAYGHDKLETDILAQALPYPAFQLERLRRGVDWEDATERGRFLERAADVIARIPSPLERDQYAQTVAREFVLPKETFLEAVGRARRSYLRRQKKVQINGMNSTTGGLLSIDSSERGPVKAHVQAEERLIAAMLDDPSWVPRVMEHVGDAFVTEVHTVIVAHLYALYEPDVSAEKLRAMLMTALDEPQHKDQLTHILLKMDEVPPLTEEAFNDLVAAILSPPLQAALKEKTQALTRALEQGRFQEAQAIKADVERLKDELNALKLTLSSS